MTKFIQLIFCFLILCSPAFAQSRLAKAGSGQPQPPSAPAESDRSRDGLIGPVRRVRTEVAKLSTVDGKPVESKHVTLEITAYDLKGNKIENQYFPIAGATLTGKEVYKYDDKGNISEMTLLNSDGSLLSKEIYKYEFDFAGNWNKMTTSVAVVDGGRITFEPSEITYRSIMYYLDENMTKMMQPAQPASSTSTQPVSSPPPTNTKPANEPKNQAAVNNNRSNGRKTSPVLPTSTVSTDELAASGDTPDLHTPASNANNSGPVVKIDTEPPTAPAPRPILKPVSGGVLNGVALSLPTPAYPEPAKRTRTSGVVTVEVVLDETGKVISAVATSGPQMLREAAIQAALKARFSPTKLSGQPVKVTGTINYKFALQ